MMSSVAIHFVGRVSVVPLGSLGLYLSVGGVAVFLTLFIFLFKVIVKKKSPPKQKKQIMSQNTGIQQILPALQKSNRRVLLAGSGLADLPVTVPVNLAVTLAGAGRCLLVDFDSKRDALAKVFEVDSSSVHTSLRMVPIQTEFENLSVWPANYFNLLKQMNIRSLLDAAEKEYEYILLYAPYLPALADRKQIAAVSQQAVIFGQNGDKKTKLHQLLEICNCKILLET